MRRVSEYTRDVRAADAACADVDFHTARPDFRRGAFFISDVLRSMEDGGFHNGWSCWLQMKIPLLYTLLKKGNFSILRIGKKRVFHEKERKKKVVQSEKRGFDNIVYKKDAFRTKNTHI